MKLIRIARIDEEGEDILRKLIPHAFFKPVPDDDDDIGVDVFIDSDEPIMRMEDNAVLDIWDGKY